MSQPNWDNKDKRIAWQSIFRTLHTPGTDPTEAARQSQTLTDKLFEIYPADPVPTTEQNVAAPAPAADGVIVTPKADWCDKPHTAFKGTQGFAKDKMLYPLDCKTCKQHSFVQSRDKTECSKCRQSQFENRQQQQAPAPEPQDQSGIELENIPF